MPPARSTPTSDPPLLLRNGAGFEPYANNGGTVVAVAGPDYCIIAADSRLSDGYTILSRNVTRVHRLSGDTHLATAGCWADTQGLLRLLEVRASSAVAANCLKNVETSTGLDTSTEHGMRRDE